MRRKHLKWQWRNTHKQHDKSGSGKRGHASTDPCHNKPRRDGMTMKKDITRRVALQGVAAVAIAAPSAAIASTGQSARLETLIARHGRLLEEWDDLNDRHSALEASQPKCPSLCSSEIDPQPAYAGLLVGKWRCEDDICRDIDQIVSSLERQRDAGIPSYVKVSSHPEWVERHQTKIDRLKQHKADAISELQRRQAPFHRWYEECGIEDIEDRCDKLMAQAVIIEEEIAALPCHNLVDAQSKAAFYLALFVRTDADSYVESMPAVMRSIAGVHWHG